jgi:hypothetical protein
MEDKNKVEEPPANYGQPLSFEKVWLMFQETDRVLTEKFHETDRQFKETDKKFQETDKKLRKLEYLFTSQWGKLIESLVKGDLVRLLNERGISVERTIERVKGYKGGKNFEFDIIALNGTELVIVEVKTTLRPKDVEDFKSRIKDAKFLMPEYKDKIIYGAVAYLIADGSSDRMAEKLGFFVIQATGNSASIVNPPDFKPKAF